MIEPPGRYYPAIEVNHGESTSQLMRRTLPQVLLADLGVQTFPRDCE